MVGKSTFDFLLTFSYVVFEILYGLCSMLFYGKNKIMYVYWWVMSLRPLWKIIQYWAIYWWDVIMIILQKLTYDSFWVVSRVGEMLLKFY